MPIALVNTTVLGVPDPASPPHWTTRRPLECIRAVRCRLGHSAFRRMPVRTTPASMDTCRLLSRGLLASAMRRACNSTGIAPTMTSGDHSYGNSGTHVVCGFPGHLVEAPTQVHQATAAATDTCREHQPHRGTCPNQDAIDDVRRASIRPTPVCGINLLTISSSLYGPSLEPDESTVPSLVVIEQLSLLDPEKAGGPPPSQRRIAIGALSGPRMYNIVPSVGARRHRRKSPRYVTWRFGTGQCR